jgi:hypothetical protein
MHTSLPAAQFGVDFGAKTAFFRSHGGTGLTLMCLDLWELPVMLRRIQVWTHSAGITRIITHISGIRSMRSNRIRGLLVLFFATAALSAPATAQQPYDGLWQVTVVTKAGSCDAQTTSTVTVSDGKISGGPVSGSVGSGGLVRVSINGAYANGQLSGNSGSGKWNGASAGVPCSGRWEASRQ